MSSVLDHDALAESPLADLHLLANELGVDGYRRLRKGDLVEALIARQAGDEPPPAAAEPAPEASPADEPAEGDGGRRPRRSRRGGRSRSRLRVEEGAADEGADELVEATEAAGGERTADGVVELLANGSGFVRVSPPEATDDDVYISAAQVKRCELVAGDRVTGPVRRPRRSERFASLLRVDTINGRPADEVAEGTRFEDLAAAFASERLELGAAHPVLVAIDTLAPFGKGSRVVLAGPGRSGKSVALRQIAEALAGRDGLELIVVLAGVRPEEIADWSAGGLPAPVAALSFAASVDAQVQALEQAVEQARRVAARGGHAVVVVDTLEYIPQAAARRLTAAARNIVDGGSLTVLATAAAPVGGETTVVAFTPLGPTPSRFAPIDPLVSGTLRPQLLVGEDGGRRIADERAQALAPSPG